jgi:hypothetical protein
MRVESKLAQGQTARAVYARRQPCSVRKIVMPCLYQRVCGICTSRIMAKSSRYVRRRILKSRSEVLQQ